MAEEPDPEEIVDKDDKNEVEMTNIASKSNLLESEKSPVKLEENAEETEHLIQKNKLSTKDQFQALFIKTLLLQSRDKKTNACQV